MRTRNHRTILAILLLTAALFQRFSSRGEDDLADRLQSAMRYQFGGHLERPVEPIGFPATGAAVMRMCAPVWDCASRRSMR